MGQNTTTSGVMSSMQGSGSPITTWLLGGVAPLLLILYITQAMYYCLFHPLRPIPGPLLARFSWIWKIVRYFRGTWLDDIVQAHQKYGRIVRIAPTEVSVVDESVLKQLYGHGKPSQKTPWYDSWIIPNMTVSFFATTNAKHHRHIRSRVTAAYSMSSILATEPLIQEVLDTNWKKLTQAIDRGSPINLSTWASYFTFDNVGQLSLGGMLGFLEREEDVKGIIKSIHDGFYLMANMGDVPGQMFWFNNSLAQSLIRNYGGKDLNAFSVFIEWLDQRVSERMEDGLEEGRRKDMLQHFIEAKDQQGQPVKKGDVMIEGVNILGAGADTTSIAILAVMGQLLLHPEAYSRLQDEVDNAYLVLDGGISGDIDFKEAERLPFLTAVIKESMRLHPSITYQLPRVVPEGGVRLESFYIPSGMTCGISPAAMNRSKELFGQDADDWNPERWMSGGGSEEGKALRVMEANLTTFGMGSRSCIGRNLALVTVHKYIAQFVHRYNATLLNKKEPWRTKSQWFSFQANFWVNLEQRTS